MSACPTCGARRLWLAEGFIEVPTCPHPPRNDQESRNEALRRTETDADVEPGTRDRPVRRVKLDRS